MMKVPPTTTQVQFMFWSLTWLKGPTEGRKKITDVAVSHVAEM